MSLETHGRWPVVGGAGLLPVSAAAAKRLALRPLAALCGTRLKSGSGQARSCRGSTARCWGPMRVNSRSIACSASRSMWCSARDPALRQEPARVPPSRPPRSTSVILATPPCTCHGGSVTGATTPDWSQRSPPHPHRDRRGARRRPGYAGPIPSPDRRRHRRSALLDGLVPMLKLRMRARRGSLSA